MGRAAEACFSAIATQVALDKCGTLWDNENVLQWDIVARKIHITVRLTAEQVKGLREEGRAHGLGLSWAIRSRLGVLDQDAGQGAAGRVPAPKTPVIENAKQAAEAVRRFNRNAANACGVCGSIGMHQKGCPEA